MTTTQPIADQIDELKAASADQLPVDVSKAFGREVAGLAAAGVPGDVATPGAVLPDVDLLDPQGAPTTLYAALGAGLAVIVFYRGAWCPYCNVALAAYQTQLLPALTTRGATLLAVSPQTPDGSLSMQEKHDLAFGVVSDPGNSLAAALGILTEPAAEALAAQRTLGLDVTAANADHTSTLPMPTALVVDSEHVLRWIDVHPDYTTRTETGQILDAVDAVR